jgi:3-oxoacyl-[acyl-carrier-protein] synthase II
MVRIPINGIGVIAPGAIGVGAFRAFLDAELCAIDTIDRFDTAGLRARKGALVRDFRAGDFIAPMKLRRMNGLSRLGLAAARLAIEDSGVPPSADCGVAVGTAFGPVRTSVEYMTDYVEKGAALASPQLFAESVANAAGSHIAIEWGLRGFNITVTQRESSALAAAMVAATRVAKGTESAALIGGIEEADEMLFSVLDRLGALAHTSSGLDEAGRPFDDRRNGFVLGEGGAVLVAGSGTREPYAWFSGFGMARDTTATVSDWGTDAGAVASAMRLAIEDAGIGVGDIDAVYASANGSRKGDDVEARAIRDVFGSDPPAIVATKGIFGEYAAGGALQLAAAVLAVAEQRLHASTGFEEGPLAVNRHVRTSAIRNVLVNSVSAGGGVICAVLSKEGV